MALSESLARETLIRFAGTYLGLIEAAHLMEHRQEGDAQKKIGRVEKTLEEIEEEYFGMESVKVYANFQLPIEEIRKSIDELKEKGEKPSVAARKMMDNYREMCNATYFVKKVIGPARIMGYDWGRKLVE